MKQYLRIIISDMLGLVKAFIILLAIAGFFVTMVALSAFVALLVLGDVSQARSAFLAIIGLHGVPLVSQARLSMVAVNWITFTTMAVWLAYFTSRQYLEGLETRKKELQMKLLQAMLQRTRERNDDAVNTKQAANG